LAEYRFRRAGRTDAQGVAQLLVDAYRTWTDGGLRPKAAFYTARDVEVDLRTKEVWVLEGAAGMVGTATLRLVGSGGNRYFYLTHLATAPILQGRGVGSLMISMIESEAQRRGVFQLRLDTAVTKKGLVAFYTARGFLRFGERFRWNVASAYESQKYVKHLVWVPPAKSRHLT